MLPQCIVYLTSRDNELNFLTYKLSYLSRVHLETLNRPKMSGKIEYVMNSSIERKIVVYQISHFSLAITKCGSLNENGPHRFLGRGIAEGVALLEEECHWGCGL